MIAMAISRPTTHRLDVEIDEVLTGFDCEHVASLPAPGVRRRQPGRIEGISVVA